jgi:hypothetical protein
MVRCQGRGLPAPPRVGLKPVVADQMTISRRKTIRSVIMRTIIDGTTDMRESPSWMLQASDGFDEGFCRTRRRSIASSPAATSGLHRARDFEPVISSKLR